MTEYNRDLRLKSLTEHIRIGKRMEDLAEASEMFLKDRRDLATKELLTTDKDPKEIQMELRVAYEFKKFIDFLIARGKTASEKKEHIEKGV
jgi:hypothetical protein